MGHEISQFEIPNRQLLAAKTQPRSSAWTGIGEAKVTNSIFGKARVRVIRKQDKVRRTFFLAVLAVAVLVTAAWQGWNAWQQMQSAPLLIDTIQVTAPAFLPEYTPQRTTSPLVANKPGSMLQTEINKLVNSQNSEPQQPSGLKPHVQMAVNPATDKPLIGGEPYVALPARNSKSSMNQTGINQPSKPLPPGQHMVPAVATHPATQSNMPATANQPVAATPHVEPSAKENTPTPSPAITSQPSSPVNAQP